MNKIEPSVKYKLLLYSAILLNIVLILLPIRDHNNTMGWIHWNFLANNSIPFYKVTGYLGSIFTLSPVITYGIGYMVSGYSVYVSATIVKITMFLYLLATGIILERIYSQKKGISIDNHKIIAFTLLNPALLMIAYETPSFDIIEIFLFTYAYFLLRYKSLNDLSFREYLLYSIPLVASVFFYLYTVALIPALIIYSKNNRDRLRLFVSVTLLSAILEFTDILLVRGSFYNYLQQATSVTIVKNALPQVIYGFQYFIPLSGYIYYLLAFFILIILPIIFKRLGFSEIASLGIIFVLFAYTSVQSSYNIFAFLFSITIIGLMSSKKISLSYRSMIIFNIIPILGVFFYNIYYGTGNTGIFYQTYYLLHIYYWFIPADQIRASITAFNIVLVGTVIITITLLILFLRRDGLSPGKILRSNDFYPSKVHTSIINKKRLFFISIIIVVLIVTSSVIYNNYDNQINMNSNDSFPSHAFNNISDPISLGYVVPFAGLYTVMGNEILFFNYSYPITFNISTSQRQIYFNGSITSIGNLNSNSTALISAKDYSLELTNSTFADLHTYGYINYSNYIGPLRGKEASYNDQLINFYYYNGSNAFTYNISNYITEGRDGYFSFIFNDTNPQRNYPIYMITSKQIIMLGVQEGYVYIGFNNYTETPNWTVTRNLVSYYSDLTDDITFHVSGNECIVYLNGKQFFFPLMSSSYYDIVTGTALFNTADWRNITMIGYGSQLIYTSISPTYKNGVVYYALAKDNKILGNINGNTVHFSVTFHNEDYLIKVYSKNAVIWGNRTSPYLDIGRMREVDNSIVVMTISSFTLRNLGFGYYLAAAFIIASIPYMLLGYSIYENRIILKRNSGKK